MRQEPKTSFRVSPFFSGRITPGGKGDPASGHTFSPSSLTSYSQIVIQARDVYDGVVMVPDAERARGAAKDLDLAGGIVSTQTVASVAPA